MRRRGSEHLGHVGVDAPLAGGGGYRYPVMAVADEVLAADAVHLDRGDRRAAPLRQRELLPAFPRPVGGGPEVPVEGGQRAGRADDTVHRYRLQADVLLTSPSEPPGDLIKPQEAVAVMLAAQAACQRGHDLVPPGSQELVLDVGPRKSGF